MILMASDYVGYRVAKYLTARGETIPLLVLDDRDTGGYNKNIEAVYRASQGTGMVAHSPMLDNESFLDQIASLNPNIGILAWWPNILKGRILSIPKKGWLNFHPSYLPWNRGKHPNFWCLIDEAPCGVTLHYINEMIDFTIFISIN